MYFCCAIYIPLNILKDMAKPFIMAVQITNCLERHSSFIETQHIYSEKLFNLPTFTFSQFVVVRAGPLMGKHGQPVSAFLFLNVLRKCAAYESCVQGPWLAGCGERMVFSELCRDPLPCFVLLFCLVFKDTKRVESLYR